MSFIGIEPERIQFSWISSAESTKFVETAKAVTEAVRSLGPNRSFAKTDSKVVEHV